MDTLSMYGMEASETAKLTDVLAYAQANSNTNVEQLGEALKYCGSSANAMGYDIEDTTALLGKFADAGLKGSIGGTTLNSMFRDMKKNAEDGAIAIGEKNVKIVDGNGNYRDMVDILGDVEKATEGMTQAEKDMALANIWGTEALKGVNIAMEAGSESIGEFEEELRNSKGTAEEMYDVMQDNLKGSIDNFKSALEGAGIVIGNILIPHIRNLVDRLTECLTWFNNLDEGTQTLIVSIGGIVASIGPLLLVFGTVLTMIPNMVAGWGILTGAMAGFTLGIPLLVAGLVAIVGGIGSSTSALDFLVDKFGVAGKIMAGFCEFMYGTIQLTFGNIFIIIQTAGKMIEALFKGQFWKLDDIAREGWSKVENNTAEAMSNIKGETTRALQYIGEASEKELNQVSSVFDASLSVLPNLTKHNIGNASKEFTNSLQGMKDEGLTILRGTSDTMAIVLEGITEDMIGTEKGTKKMEANLESLARTGSVNAKDLENEVSKAMQTINSNIVSEGDKLKQNATDIFNAFKTVSTSSVKEMADNVSQSIWQMGEGTVSELTVMGGTWSSILSGVKDDTTMSTQQMRDKIVENLSSMGITGEQLINQLRTESVAHMKALETEASQSVSNTNDNVTKEFEEAKTNATASTEATKNEVTKDMQEASANVANESSKINKSMSEETKKGGDSVKQNMGKASKDAQTEAKNISKSVDKEMKNSTKTIQQEATNMYNGVKTSFSKMSQISKQETTNMYKGVQTSFKAMESSAKSSATSMYKGVTTSFRQMANSAISDWDRIKSALSSPITGTVKINVQGVQQALNQINSIKNSVPKSVSMPNQDVINVPRYTEGDLQRSLYSMVSVPQSSNDVNINVKASSDDKKENNSSSESTFNISLNIEKMLNSDNKSIETIADELAFHLRRKNIAMGGVR